MTTELLQSWLLPNPRKKLIESETKVVRHGRYVASRVVAAAAPRNIFADSLLSQRVGVLSPMKEPRAC